MPDITTVAKSLTSGYSPLGAAIATKKIADSFIGTEKEMFGVFLLTAIPLPMTGAYTASILAWFFNLNKTKSAKAIGYGVAVAGLIVMGITLGLWGLFS